MHQSAKQIYAQGEEWIAQNPKAWKHLKVMVLRDMVRDDAERLRISYYVEQVRHDDCVSIPNAIKAYLARRLEKDVRGAKFTKRKSKLNLVMANEETENA